MQGRKIHEVRRTSIHLAFANQHNLGTLPDTRAFIAGNRLAYEDTTQSAGCLLYGMCIVLASTEFGTWGEECWPAFYVRATWMILHGHTPDSGIQNVTRCLDLAPYQWGWQHGAMVGFLAQCTAAVLFPCKDVASVTINKFPVSSWHTARLAQSAEMPIVPVSPQIFYFKQQKDSINAHSLISELVLWVVIFDPKAIPTRHSL